MLTEEVQHYSPVVNVQDHLSSAVKDWVASGGTEEKEKAIQEILESSVHRALPYQIRNRDFITSHKLQKLDYDPFLCKLECVDLIPPPVSQKNDAFVVGQALDDLASLGEQPFRNRYVAVGRRDKKTEEANPGKILLTNGQMETVENAMTEYRSRHFFPQTLQKMNVLCVAYGLPLKAELDGFDKATNRIQDLKTTANLNSFLDDFQPCKLAYERYVFQQATYAFIWEMKNVERVDGAELLVVDKWDWARSHKFVISYPTLKAQFPRIEKLLQDWRNYRDSGIWPFLLNLSNIADLKKFNDSPYYSHPLCKQFKDSIPETIL